MHMFQARSNSTLTRPVRAQVATKLKTGRAAEVSAAPAMLRQISDKLCNTLQLQAGDSCARASDCARRSDLTL